MRLFKVHIVIFFLGLFILGTFIGVAVAHCGHDGFAADHDTSMHMPSQNDEAEEAACGSHDHGSASVKEMTPEHSGGHSNDHGANSADCDDCSGVPCQNQIQIPGGSTPAFCIHSDEIHSLGKIDLKTVVLSIIPDPPNTLS